MSSIDDAIEAMFETFPEWTESYLGVAARKGIEAAVESGHLIPADQLDDLLDARLEQLGYLAHVLGPGIAVMQIVKSVRAPINGVQVYRKRELR